jgi:hypothetical protein
MASGTYNFPSSTDDVANLEVRITWSSTYNAATNASNVTASLQARRTDSLTSTGRPQVRITVDGQTETRNDGTVSISDDWVTLVSETKRNILHDSNNGTKSITITGGVSSGNTDPLVGSTWDKLNTRSTTATLDNAQLYPVVPSYGLARSSVNLTANTSTVSLTSSPETTTTTSSGFVTGGVSTITRLFAKSATATSDAGLTYSSFSSTVSASPLERVWTKITSTADGVSTTNTLTSTSNIASTIYGYPSPPTSISTTKAGRKVTVTYGNSLTNGGFATSPTYTIERSINSGSSWESHNNEDLLTPAATYIFRVSATNAVGTSLYTQSSPVFVSAYGSRFISSTERTPVSMAKIFIGIGQPGADAGGWKVVTNVKRFDGSTWIDLQT